MKYCTVESNRPTDEVGKDLPVWDPVSSSEICEKIATLKNEKVPGVDGIVGEIYKAAPNWWASIFSTIFTEINVIANPHRIQQS